MFPITESVLRRLLWIDAMFCMAVGISHLLFANRLSAAMGMPENHLKIAAIVAIIAAVFALWLACREALFELGVRTLAGSAFVWVATSFWLALASGVGLTRVGTVWTVTQATLIGLLAGLQWMGASPRASGRQVHARSDVS